MQPEPRSALMEWPGEMRPEEEKKASAPAPAAAPAALWQTPNDGGFWSQAGQAYLRTISSLPAAPWSSRKAKETNAQTPAPPSPPSPPSPPRDERPLAQLPPTALYESSPPVVQAAAQPALTPPAQAPPPAEPAASMAAEDSVPAPAAKQP